MTKYQSFHLFYNAMTRIGDIMVIVFASSAVDRGFEPRLGQTHVVNPKTIKLVFVASPLSTQH